MNIGVVGLGNMGKPMARNLAVAGDTVLAYDLNAGAMEEVRSEFIHPAAGVDEIASRCELIVIMVWDDAALREVVFGERGILAATEFRGCAIDLSTTSVAVVREISTALSSRGAVFLDGAVIGGGVPAAKVGKSPIVLSGPRSAFDAHFRVLSRLGTCDYVGDQGAAKVVKILNNLLVGVVTAANAEALSLGLAAGLRLPDMVEALGIGPATSTVLESYMGRYVREGRYGEGLIGHALMAKDLSLACELATEVGAPAHFAEAGRQAYLEFGRTLGPEKPFPTAFDYYRHRFLSEEYPLLESAQAC